MKNAKNMLIHQSAFSQIHNRYQTQIPNNPQVLSLLAKLIKKTQEETRELVQPKIAVRPNVTMPEYQHRNNTIVLPYKSVWTGVDYYLSWIHEFEHAKQQSRLNESANHTEEIILRISRLIYPNEPTDQDGNPKPEYLYNYTELQARIVEAHAFAQVVAERRKEQPPNFFVGEKKKYLDSAKRFLENTKEQCNMITMLKYLVSQSKAILNTKDVDNVLSDISRAQALRLWRTQVIPQTIIAFRQFIKERNKIAQLATELNHEISNYSQTQIAEERQIVEYNEQQQRLVQSEAEKDKVMIITWDMLPEELPKVATQVLGHDAMLQYLKEYHGELQNICILQPPNNKEPDAIYLVFYKSDIVSDHINTTVSLPEKYPELPSEQDFWDALDTDVILEDDEISI